MASIRTLRTISVVSLVPGFPLLIATGAMSTYAHETALPAVGLAPLFFSSAFNLWLLISGGSSEQQDSTHPSPVRSHAHPNDGGESQLRPGSEEEVSGSFEKRHPILVFLADVIFAASLMIVLVFTWIDMAWWYGYTAHAVLAAYATIPLLTNFFIHLWLAIREFSVGTGLTSLFNRIRYRGIPADCPGCGVNIRPATPPTPPWFQPSTGPPVLSSFRQVSFSVPAVIPSVFGQAKAATRDWKAPAWMKGAGAGGHGHETAPLIASQEEAGEGSEAYRDDYDEDAVTVRPSVDLIGGGAGAAGNKASVEEVVVTKKDKNLKGKGNDEEVGTW